MRDETKRDDRSRWSTTDVPTGRIVEIDPTDGELVSATDTGRRRDRGRRGREASTRGRMAQDETIQRVGGRRWLRPEIVLLVVGAVFVIGGLVKPWPNPIRTSAPSPIAVASPAATITDGPSPEANLYVAPYNYRGATASPGSATTPGASPNPTPPWSTVDWGLLRASDTHSTWGFASAVMPNGLVGPDASTPNTSWIDAGTPPKYAAVALLEGRSVYAIAITWPSTVVVTSVTFVYLGPPQSPAYLPPPGFLTDTAVTPIPAGQVAALDAAPTETPSIHPSTNGASGIISSGQFWVPPRQASSSNSSKSVPAAWQANPWPWPYGSYQITVRSQSGTQNIIFYMFPV